MGMVTYKATTELYLKDSNYTVKVTNITESVRFRIQIEIQRDIQPTENEIEKNKKNDQTLAKVVSQESEYRGFGHRF